MARITRSTANAANNPLAILNSVKNGTAMKPKGPTEAARRLVGRPAKRRKTSHHEASQIDKGRVDRDDNGRGDVMARKAVGGSAGDDSVHPFSPSNGAVTRSKKRRANHQDDVFNLQDGVFDAVVADKGVEAELAVSPSPKATRMISAHNAETTQENDEELSEDSSGDEPADGDHDDEEEEPRRDQAEHEDEDEEGEEASDDDTETQSTKGIQSRAKAARELHDCGKDWDTACGAAKNNRARDVPLTSLVQKVSTAISEHKSGLLQGAYPVPDDEVEVLGESALESIVTLMGGLREDGSQSGKENKRLLRDIYLHTIPEAVDLLWSILFMCYSNGEVGKAALEELIDMLKATCELCRRVYRWKRKPSMEENVKSRTNKDIKISLENILGNYRSARSELEAADQKKRAKIRAKRIELKRAAEHKAHARHIEESRRKIAGAATRYRQRKNGSRQQTMSPRQYTQKVTKANNRGDVIDVDDISDDGLVSSAPFIREATEEVPEAPGRSWQREENIALLLLLQRHRGSDRYLRIKESISEISRDIRKLGAEEVLATMAGQRHLDVDVGNVADTLDALGQMEVADVEQQAQYLKAAQGPRIEREIRTYGNGAAWEWLLSV